jgi:hypothetical protein
MSARRFARTVDALSGALRCRREETRIMMVATVLFALIVAAEAFWILAPMRRGKARGSTSQN